MGSPRASSGLQRVHTRQILQDSCLTPWKVNWIMAARERFLLKPAFKLREEAC
jgi:hypothetical protein